MMDDPKMSLAEYARLYPAAPVPNLIKRTIWICRKCRDESAKGKGKCGYCALVFPAMPTATAVIT